MPSQMRAGVAGTIARNAEVERELQAPVGVAQGNQLVQEYGRERGKIPPVRSHHDQPHHGMRGAAE